MNRSVLPQILICHLVIRRAFVCDNNSVVGDNSGRLPRTVVVIGFLGRAPFAANEFPFGGGMMLAKIDISPRSLSMTALAVALLLSLVGARSSKAQVASNKQLTAAQVLGLQKRFQAATVASDARTIEKLMADDGLFVHGNALMQSKAEFVEAANKRRFRISSFEITDPKVVFFDGGAIVSGVEDIVLAPRAAGERPLKVRMRVSAVWVARPGGWQLILNQSTPIQQPPSPAAAPQHTPSR
jgi:ketosteroid isomerase-like protein